jgi:hypothetical protein
MAASASASAQTSDGGFDRALSTSLASTTKAMFATIRRDLADAADAMPVEDYAFKPHPDSRDVRALVGHVASANWFLLRDGEAHRRCPHRRRPEASVDRQVALVKRSTNRSPTATRSTIRRRMGTSGGPSRRRRSGR